MTTQEGLPALATDAELAELRAGLEGVTPGPWYISTDDDGEQFVEAKYQTSPLSTYVVSIAYEMRDAELRYLPLVSPDRIRALLDRLEAAERQVKELTEALDTFQEPKQFSAAVHRAMAHYHSKCAEKIDGKPSRAALEAKSHDD
jgi:hypothetical protein